MSWLTPNSLQTWTNSSPKVILVCIHLYSCPSFMFSDFLEIVLLSLEVTGLALIFSTILGVPAGALIGLNQFRGRKLTALFLYTGMGFPPVVIGLFVYLLLTRNGGLGALSFSFIPQLFTPAAMVLAQIIIAFPIIAGFTMAAVMGVDRDLKQQLLSLGATHRQATSIILSEARIGVIVAIIAGFGGIISEVGAVMLVGGNIEGSTRVLTTAIVLETRKGNFYFALSLGAVLIAITFLANLIMLRLQGRGFDE
jgi:tungstate transport system permease protein